METSQILREIDSEIQRLQQVRTLLAGSNGSPTANHSSAFAAPKKRIMSPEARARIAAAQKKRWAKAKKAA